MILGYKDDLTIERVDNDAGYSKSNCIWANPIVQARNKRNNKKILGKTIAEWSQILGVSDKVLYWRREKGWSDKEVLYGK